MRLVGDDIDELERLGLAIRCDFLRHDVMKRTAPLGVGEGFFLILGKVGEAEGGKGCERCGRRGGQRVNGARFRVVGRAELGVPVLFHNAHLGGGRGCCQAGDGEPCGLRIELRPFPVDGFFEVGDAVDEGVRLRIIRLIEWNGQDGRVARAVSVAGVVEEAEACVVFLVLDGVVGMAVALHATHGKPLENLPGGDVAVHRGDQAELLVVGAALAVSLGQAMEGGREFLIERRAGDEIAGELVDDELVVGKIPVECIDDPVAVFPDITVGVVAEAFGIGVAGEIHPDGSPAFAEVRGGEQALGFGGDGGGEILCGGGLEGVEFCDGRRQADEIKGSAAQPLGGLGGGGGREVFAFQLGEDETVDVIRGPRGVFHGGGVVGFRRGERPVLTPLRSLGDPLPQRFHIRIAEARTVFGLRHEVVGIIGDHAGDHFRLLRLPGHDDGFPGLAFP